ncbi:MAG: hypothetical protein A2X46_16190 [Lentisphaerae bacterium GWF2_57_35]|nr:MAG: hypothetical protein A2X46_16190 [Lentisphaerae bacterium GWF2_57_35]
MTFQESEEQPPRENNPREYVEPEVLPPEGKLKPSAAERAFGPVVAGIIIDLVDLATFGPIGLALGFVFGGSVAWYLCRLYGLPLRQKLLWSLAAGIYCTIPFTEFIPVGTLVGAFIRYRELKSEAAERKRIGRSMR